MSVIARRTATSSPPPWDLPLAPARRCRSHDRIREPEDILRDLGLAVAQEERDATVERVDHAPTVAHDRVIDLPADRVLDVRDADAS
jgi:hypothetical protein